MLRSAASLMTANVLGDQMIHVAKFKRFYCWRMASTWERERVAADGLRED